MKETRYHDEILAVFGKLANPSLGRRIAEDRTSNLQYLGIRTPQLRRVVKQGFSFYAEPEERILGIWDDLFRHSPYGEVLFAALEYYAPIVKKDTPRGGTSGLHGTRLMRSSRE